MNRTVSTFKTASIFALSGLVGPIIAGIDEALRGNAMPDFLIYNVVNLLWPVRMLGVYDYSVVTLILVSVLLAATIGAVTALLSTFVHFAFGYLVIATWVIFVWMYFSGFDARDGHKLPLVISLFVQLGTWAIARRIQKPGKQRLNTAKRCQG